MQKGDVRGPVTGPQGLHVFYVGDVKQSELQGFNEMKDQLRQQLRRRELDKQTALWTEELRKNTLNDHRAILEAIAAHDVSGARQAMRAHLERVTRTFSRG